LSIVFGHDRRDFVALVARGVLRSFVGESEISFNAIQFFFVALTVMMGSHGVFTRHAQI
jgi:hypothetical protein